MLQHSLVLGHATDWHHFRSPPASGGGPTEVYEADHAPAIGWRYPAPAPAAGHPGTSESSDPVG